MAFKVLSYNIRDGGGERLPAIAEIVRAEQPDAVALIEANSLTNAERLAADLGMSLVYGEANSAASIAWLSRLPIQSSQNHRLAALAKTLLQIDVEGQGVTLSLFATHLVHGRGEADAEQRTEEARAILEMLRPFEGRPHLLAGDFNALHPDDTVGRPPSDVRAGTLARRPIHLLLEAGYVDCYRSHNPTLAGYTYPAHHPWLRLDYIFASPSLAPRLSGCGMVEGELAARASDHLPIWARWD